MTDPLGQLIAPILGALLVTLLTWSLNRTLRHGQPMTALSRKFLTHGFLFALGAGLFIGWDSRLAVLLGFPGREVWGTLTALWAVLLIYDAHKRLQREREIAADLAVSEATAAHPTGESVRTYVLTAMRFLLFFAVIGAITRRTIVGIGVAAALSVGVYLAERRWRVSSVPISPSNSHS